MNIVVCVKQVPNTNEVKTDPKTGTLIREGVPVIINPEDKVAVEAALQLNGNVIVLSMGPPQAEEALREALAMGAHEAMLLCDVKFAGSDTWATANALAAAIKRLSYDLIICGRQAIDGDTAQVGPQLAESLALPQISYVQKIEINENKIIAHRELEDGYEIVEAKLPALITVTKELHKPRYASLHGINSAYEKEIKVLTAKDIGADEKTVGLKSSPTKVKKIFTPQGKSAGVKLEGDIKTVCQKLICILKEKEIIREF